jgi:lysophospholipid acyltransferase (LPLAT)-like uncharacterized protein
VTNVPRDRLKYIYFIAMVPVYINEVIVADKVDFKRKWRHFWRDFWGFFLFQWIIAICLAIPIWFIYLTTRKEFRGMDTFRKYRNKSAIFVAWHGRSMMFPPLTLLGGVRGYVVTSQHKDGRMMAKLQRLFGMRAIYGSTSKGGVSVLKQGVRVLRDGRYVVSMAPDGPSGPALKLHDGALYFAKMSGAPIIPVCFSCSKPWFQKRWDRYLVATPFSRVTCEIGKPIFVDSKISDEEFKKMRQYVEDVMVKQLRDMDAEFGLEQVEQGIKASEYKRRAKAQKQAKRDTKKKLKHRG